MIINQLPDEPQTRSWYRAVAEDRNKRIYRTHDRVNPGVFTLKSLSWPAYRWAHRFLSPWRYAEDILLDLGGGSGNFSYLFKDKVRKVIVLDLVFAPLASITEDSTYKIQADIFKIPLRDSSISKILFSDVMEHFMPHHVPPILQEIHRILAPGGKVFVNTSCYGFYLRKHFYQLTGRPGVGRLDWADFKDGHFNRLKHQEMLDLFASADFRVSDYRFLKHLFQPLPRICRYLLTRKYSEAAASSAEDSRSACSGQQAQRFVRAAVNFWSYLDLVVWGKRPGGAAFYKLEKM